MSDKPSYLGLLNAIAVNEAHAHRYLQVWIDTTTDPEVEAVLRTVAWREGEHGLSFGKRINELGFEVRPRDDLGIADRLAVAASDRSDLEKMEYFGQDRLDEVLGAFDTIFSDHSIDIQTGELAVLNDKVDALCRAVDELRQIVCAQTMPTKAS